METFEQLIATLYQSISSSALLPVITAEKNNSGANFTIMSKATKTDFTYKISRSQFKGTWYTHISVETQYLEFKYLGSYFKGRIYRKGGEITTPAAIGIAWVLSKVEANNFAWVDRQCEIMHTGHCLRCGRELTDATSIQIGLGPICRNI